MHYPGSKNSSFRHLINQIPPHHTTGEEFDGSAALIRRLRPAPGRIVIDADARALERLAAHPTTPPGTQFVHADALTWLEDNEHRIGPGWFLYADPPYLWHVRSSRRRYYRHEFGDISQHLRLLTALQSLDCHVMVSGYWSVLYEMQIGDWRTLTYNAVTRNGPRAEWLWMNYPQPEALHDYRWLGEDYRERERIKRKISRWLSRLDCMDKWERQALLSAITQRPH